MSSNCNELSAYDLYSLKGIVRVILFMTRIYNILLWIIVTRAFYLTVLFHSLSTSFVVLLSFCFVFVEEISYPPLFVYLLFLSNFLKKFEKPTLSFSVGTIFETYKNLT
jgi:hypothetical protein